MKFSTYIFIICFFFYPANLLANDSIALWHGIERSVRYQPKGNDIVIENGNRRFNRALYGGNTAFRAEAGDLPEFALYMPGMGGNIQFGIVKDGQSKWLREAKRIKAIYRAGSMLYEVSDPLWGDAVIYLYAIALYDREGLMVRVDVKKLPASCELVVIYGGATGKKFSRDGDIGADPESSFYLKPEYCKDNIYHINQNSFELQYGFTAALSETERYEIQHLPSGPGNVDKENFSKKMQGVFAMPASIADASAISSPLALKPNSDSKQPVVTGSKVLGPNSTNYFFVGKLEGSVLQYDSLKSLFDRAEGQRRQIANRVSIQTPDPYINTLGPVLSIAADAIWEAPSYMHGAVAWRMRLNGWRGAYIADVLGWHERAQAHFDGYAASQLTAPAVKGVVMDTALHLGRHLEKIGTALFSEGYISRNPYDSTRAHHYDMNLVFVDQLLNHFNWMGDTGYVRKMWPMIKRHLAWEKRNFDADNDGLYDSYAAIWASDALQYSGGGVTHSSAYNYRANKAAAFIARLMGDDAVSYQLEAEKILQAVNKELWLKDKGWYAEYKDLLGKKLVHGSPAVWTMYHAIDEGISDPFQAYQTLCFIDHQLPHIPIKAKGLSDNSLYTIPTTNWQPYTWSLNNVALAELLHTSLAYWQAGRSNDAFTLWKSSLMESMYLGASPGNIQQLSFYDAIRGELYRDFADPIGMAGRTVVEGLFGINPNALQDSMLITPGFPDHWHHANLTTPDINFSFKRKGEVDQYSISIKLPRTLKTQLRLAMTYDDVASIMVNGKSCVYSVLASSIGKPIISIQLPLAKTYDVIVRWKGNRIKNEIVERTVSANETFIIKVTGKKIVALYDPQSILVNTTIKADELKASVISTTGKHVVFAKIHQGKAIYWQPVHINIKDVEKEKSGVSKNRFRQASYKQVDLSAHFNDKVTNIFRHEYLSPRPTVPTLQLPTQGIGNWAYPLTMADINDSGLRAEAKQGNNNISSRGIVFATPADTMNKNILFTSQWDNFPASYTVPMSGKASMMHVLMTGTTSPMQSRVTNGRLIVSYSDETSDSLELMNPTNWWPIEQDYFIDGFAFNAGEQRLERLLLKTGEFISRPPKYESIKGFSNFAIAGGAASVLHMNINPDKKLKSLTVEAVANDVIIGLMAATLETDQ